MLELNSSNFNFSKAKNNGEDLRFTWLNKTSMEEEPCDYFIDYYNSTEEKAKVWVKIPYVPANGNATVYLYYGNENASSAFSLP